MYSNPFPRSNRKGHETLVNLHTFPKSAATEHGEVWCVILARTSPAVILREKQNPLFQDCISSLRSCLWSVFSQSKYVLLHIRSSRSAIWFRWSNNLSPNASNLVQYFFRTCRPQLGNLDPSFMRFSYVRAFCDTARLRWSQPFPLPISRWLYSEESRRYYCSTHTMSRSWSRRYDLKGHQNVQTTRCENYCV